MKKSEILAALPKLNRADLEAVHAVTSSLLGAATVAPTGKAALQAAELFNALAAALGLAIGFQAAPATLQKQFMGRLPGLLKFLNDNFKGWDAKKTSQLAFTRMLFELLAADLKSRGLKPTIGVMVANIGNMPTVFDDAFPGYLDERVLAALVLKKFQ